MRIGKTQNIDLSILEELKNSLSPGLIEGSSGITDDLLKMAGDFKTRRNLRNEILEYKNYLCIWRITEGEEEWDLFLSTLYTLNVSQRDIDLIKRVTNEEYIKIYHDYKDQFKSGTIHLNEVTRLETDCRGRIAITLKNIELAQKINDLLQYEIKGP